MTILTSYDWESDTWTHNNSENPARTAFREAVEAVAAKARTALPESNGRIDKAVHLILNGDISIDANGEGTIASQSNGTGTYNVGKGEFCSCKDKAPKNLCKHLLCYHIFTRATALAKQRLEAQAESPHPEPGTPESPVETPATTTIPQEFIVEIHGKQFVQYAGLLVMAHDRGLVNLSANFITVSGELALAEASAEFSDGRTFKECADATPGKVNAKIRPHFPRMALTRAKARCLRDALNISVCSVEEMET